MLDGQARDGQQVPDLPSHVVEVAGVRGGPGRDYRLRVAADHETGEGMAQAYESARISVPAKVKGRLKSAADVTKGRCRPLQPSVNVVRANEVTRWRGVWNDDRIRAWVPGDLQGCICRAKKGRGAWSRGAWPHAGSGKLRCPGGDKDDGLDRGEAFNGDLDRGR